MGDETVEAKKRGDAPDQNEDSMGFYLLYVYRYEFEGYRDINGEDHGINKPWGIVIQGSYSQD